MYKTIIYRVLTYRVIWYIILTYETNDATKDTPMNRTQAAIHTSLETRDRYHQVTLEGAALRGELGIDAQLIALSAQYLELKAAGKLEQAQAVKARAYEIHQAR